IDVADLETASSRGRIILKWPAVAGPEAAVAVATHPVSLHEHPLAEAPPEFARGIEIVDRRLGSHQRPGSALVVWNEVDRRSPFHPRIRGGPVLDHPIRITDQVD